MNVLQDMDWGQEMSNFFVINTPELESPMAKFEGIESFVVGRFAMEALPKIKEKKAGAGWEDLVQQLEKIPHWDEIVSGLKNIFEDKEFTNGLKNKKFGELLALLIKKNAEHGTITFGGYIKYASQLISDFYKAAYGVSFQEIMLQDQVMPVSKITPINLVGKDVPEASEILTEHQNQEGSSGLIWGGVKFFTRVDEASYQLPVPGHEIWEGHMSIAPGVMIKELVETVEGKKYPTVAFKRKIVPGEVISWSVSERGWVTVVNESGEGVVVLNPDAKEIGPIDSMDGKPDMELDGAEMRKILPHQDPFLFVQETARAELHAKENEACYFEVVMKTLDGALEQDFSDGMPKNLLLEQFMQAGGSVLMKHHGAVLAGVSNISYTSTDPDQSMINSGETIKIRVEAGAERRGTIQTKFVVETEDGSVLMSGKCGMWKQ